MDSPPQAPEQALTALAQLSKVLASDQRAEAVFLIGKVLEPLNLRVTKQFLGPKELSEILGISRDAANKFLHNAPHTTRIPGCRWLRMTRDQLEKNLQKTST